MKQRKKHVRFMSKNKLAKFADMAAYPHVFEYPYSKIKDADPDIRGRWRDFFGNDNPIVVELGCGRGEYTVGLAGMFPRCNFIGVDIKGARMWSGATESLAKGLGNVAFGHRVAGQRLGQCGLCQNQH